MPAVVVTDSSSRLPADLCEKWSIRVVPLHILLDDGDLRDGVDEIPEDVYKRDATTAAATPAELSAAYGRALAESGGDGVVAVHISSGLSGTCVPPRTAGNPVGPARPVWHWALGARGNRFQRGARRAGRGRR